LEALTFPDASFDLVITQEVFEHIFEYRRAFREVMRTVRAGGAHIFTTPKYKQLRRTQDRAVRQNGSIVHLTEPEHYGDDICDIIWKETGCPTTIYVIRDDSTGTIAEFMDVFVTRKV
jgi:SAM-dependent methyltransferase